MGASSSSSSSSSGPQPPSQTAHLFLDIDGVLNSQETRLGVDVAGHLPADRLLDNLQSITGRIAPLKIVLSSTWRLDAGQTAAVEAALAERGLALDSPCTPDLSGRGDRVDEILQSLGDRGLDPARDVWLALDDMDMLKMNPKLDGGHFCRTDDAVGLTRQNVSSKSTS
jgi:hypothetical protein